ncbi:MAG TPA: dTDP-4-dehydrorhamnose 3,5-epimerase [Anaerolineales bacterium]|nr:dTDP-4-dehydrorhamnose 3,5-epimerase [Anaerolineales bacterium]
MPEIVENTRIRGVYQVYFSAFNDSRGSFRETFRFEWFPQISWRRVQMNRSDSQANVLRGLHYHFKQVDYWLVQRGTIRVGLADLRPTSPTYRAVEALDIGVESEMGLLIPIGVAHGFVALTDATLTYVVNNYYDNSDEFGVAWNDPDLQIPWGVQSPVLSPRDEKNPRLRDLPLMPVPPFME